MNSPQKRPRSRAVLSAILILTSLIAFAAAPTWWSERGVLDTASPNDFGPANAGQLKNIATKARDELDANLPLGSGTAVKAMVLSFTGSNNYAPINLGQLKAVAKPFYQQLILVGYTNNYPWTYTTGAVNLQPANIGQVKNLFSFDVTKDTDSIGLPDWWQKRYFGDLVDKLLHPLTAASESPGDSGTGKGWTLEDDFQNGTDPTKNDTDGDGTNDTQDQYPLDPNRNQDVPVTQLAALDISGSNTDNNDVTLVALADDNSAAFAYNKVEGSGTSCIVKTWQNGNLNTVTTFALKKTGVVILTDTVTRTYTPGWLLPDGTVYGTWKANGDEEHNNANKHAEGSFSVAPGGDPTILDAPDPYKIVDNAFIDNNGGFYVLGVAANGYCGWTDDAAPGIPKCNYISCSGTFTVFDTNPPGNVPADIKVVHKDFMPYTMNNNGWAIGSGTNGVLYDGSDVTNNLGSGSPVAINDQNDILLSGTDSQGNWHGYLWHGSNGNSGSSKEIHDDLLPATYQGQIKNIHPKLLSNENPNNHNAYSIKFTADNLEGDGNGTWVNRTFLLTTGTDPAVSGSNASVSIISQPDGASISFNGLNVKSILAGIGNAGSSSPTPGDHHAVLGLAVEVYDDSLNQQSMAFQNEIIPLVQIQGSPTVVDAAWIKANGVAYIKASGDGTGDDGPVMPKLVARTPITPSGVNYEWYMEVKYDRGNGAKKDRNQSEDTVRIPKSGAAKVAANEDWKIYRWTAQGETESDWDKEIDAHGFFGGTAKIFWRQAGGNWSSSPNYIFTIGGKNPTNEAARSYIDGQVNSNEWFSYAIAKEETAEYRFNGSYYNQFRSNPSKGKVGMPTWNLDSKDEPGGYGIYQLTGSVTDGNANIPRRQIWNWQNNVDEYFSRMRNDIFSGLASRFNNSRRNLNPSAYDACPASSQIIHYGSHDFPSDEAIWITRYNGWNTNIVDYNVRYVFTPNAPPPVSQDDIKTSGFRWYWNPPTKKNGKKYLQLVEEQIE